MSQPHVLFGLTEQELRLTAAVYAKLSVHKYLREHGRLPDTIGGAHSLIVMKVVLNERGRDLTLTADEQAIYDAIVREQRLPGGAVRLIPEEPT